MKKIVLPILILILAGGVTYNFWYKGSGDQTPITNPSPAENPTDTREEDMGNMEPETTPPTPPASETPTPPPPGNVDDLGDVDVAPPKVFNITGKNFSFSQGEIRVKKGDRVLINFESTDGFHDWVVDEFNAKTDRVSTGQSSSVEFIADKSGVFEFYCSVGTHRAMGMKGQLIVE